VRTLSTTILALVVTGAFASAQLNHKPTYQDLVLVRNRPWAKKTFLEVRGGLLGGLPSGVDKLRQAEDTFGFGGHVFYHQERAFGRQGALDAYAGRDGAYVGLTEGDPSQQRGYSRLELFGRQWGQFIREGFYRSGDFVPVGLYRNTDWRARLSFATQFAQSVRGEIGAFYGQNRFKTYSRTDPAFTIPDDYNVYGFHVILEDNKLQVDPVTYLTTQGYVLSVLVEREWNSSNRLFGIAGRQSALPSAVVRANAHLEWYFPYTNQSTWIITVDGSISPEDDRIRIYDASKPVGETYLDGRIDYRILLGDKLSVTPGVRAQWVRIRDEFGTTKTSEFFLGGQVEARFDMSESLAITLEYSYLSNESREPVSLSRDSIGEQRLFFGFEFRP